MNQFLAAMHRLLQAISQLAQVAAAYGESRGRSWSSQVQMHHMLESLQIQASFKGKKNYNLILCFTMYSLIDMRQFHILFNSAKTWPVIVYWVLCFPLNLPEMNLKLFWASEQNNFRFSLGKVGRKYRNQQTITCQILAELNKLWSCLIFIKL